MNDKKLQIRNSTVDFLVFTKDAGEDSVEVRVQNGDVWLTQKGISQLFDVDRSVITKHLKNIFSEGELEEDSTCANFAQVADNGKTYQYKFYSLKAIIAVGYRTNSERATQFRQWATKVLDVFSKQGYVLDKERLINGQIFDKEPETLKFTHFNTYGSSHFRMSAQRALGFNDSKVFCCLRNHLEHLCKNNGLNCIAIVRTNKYNRDSKTLKCAEGVLYNGDENSEFICKNRAGCERAC